MGLPAWGAWPYPSAVAPQQELEMLKAQARALEEELESIRREVSTLEKAATQEKK
jgi:prefoldin subunit 5